MFQELISTSQDVIVGAVVTAASRAVVAIGVGTYRYLTGFMPKIAPKLRSAQRDPIEADVVCIAVIVLIGSEPQVHESLRLWGISDQ
jgi:hypothetical protein